MRIVTGKHVREMTAADLAAWRTRYPETTLDLGAGDGRFVRRLALRGPDQGVIGVDLCAASLSSAARNPPDNALLVVADALALPDDLSNVATTITITCPWGSLLRELL